MLVTRFFTPDGVGEVTDYMPIGARRVARATPDRPPRRGGARHHDLPDGVYPAFDYAREEHETRIVPGGVTFASSDLSLGLASFIPYSKRTSGPSPSSRCKRNSPRYFVLREIEAGEDCGYVLHDGGRRDLHADRRVLAPLALQMHLHGPLARDGPPLGPDPEVADLRADRAIVAAPTMGLPEGIGGERNWDYRYTWIRDGIHPLRAPAHRVHRRGRRVHKLAGISLPEVQARRSLQLMYGIDGRQDLREETLDHLDGYRGSRPVRLGNGAYDQLQLDIYGELMDAVYLYNKHGSPISYDLWTHLRA